MIRRDIEPGPIPRRLEWLLAGPGSLPRRIVEIQDLFRRANYNPTGSQVLKSYPSFFLLDWVVYPEHKYSLLIIRGAVTVSLFAVYLFLPRVEDPYHFPLILFSFFLVSFGISFMCFITGDGVLIPLLRRAAAGHHCCHLVFQYPPQELPVDHYRHHSPTFSITLVSPLDVQGPYT